LHLVSHYLDKLDSVPDEFVRAVEESYRIDRRLSQDTPTPAAKAVALKISSKDISLSLLCPTFGDATFRAGGNGCRHAHLGICPPDRIALRRPADRSDLAGPSQAHPAGPSDDRGRRCSGFS
jgi:hypothetical protein